MVDSILIAVFCQTTLVLGTGVLCLLALRRAPGVLRSFIGRSTFVASAACLLLSCLASRPPAIPTASNSRESGLASQAGLDSKDSMPGIDRSAPFAITESDPGSEWTFAYLGHCWIAGSALLFVWTGAGILRIRRIVRESSPIVDAESVHMLHTIASKIGARIPSLRESDSISSPILAGILDPVILLPKLNRNPIESEALQAVLAHELAHRRRHDCAWMLASRILCAVLWTQPLAWILSRLQSESAEDACDEEVMQKTMDSRAFGRALIRLSERFSGASIHHALSVISRPSSLARRIRRIVSYRPAGRSSILGITFYAAGCVAIGTLAAILWPMPVQSAEVKASRTSAEERHSAPIPLAFEGIADYVGNGSPDRMRIRYDRGSYRIDYLYQRVKGGDFVHTRASIFDGSLGWDLNLVRRTARPSIASVYNQLRAEAHKSGEAAVRARHGIIDSFMPSMANHFASESITDFPTLYRPYDPASEVFTKWETVAGYRCKVYEYRRESKTWNELSLNGRSLEEGLSTVQRSWVEPKTNMVLKWEVRELRSKIRSYPLLRISREMLSFRILRRIPASAFRIPIGFTAMIPEQFRDVKLPAGVVRKDEPGIGMGGVTHRLINDSIQYHSARKQRAEKRRQQALARGDNRRAEIELSHIRRIDEHLIQFRQRQIAKPAPIPRFGP